MRQERGYDMDRRFFDLINMCQACTVLANFLARNANNSKDAESYAIPRLDSLLTEMSRCLTLLRYEVHSQTSEEPFDPESNISI